MSIRVAIQHKTTYTFDRMVNLSHHIIRLRPAPHTRTPIQSYGLRIEPKENFINWQQDAFGNFLARVVFPEKCKKLVIDVEVVAEMTTINPFDFFVEEYAENFPFTYEKSLVKELSPYLETIKTGRKFAEFLDEISREKKTINDFLVEVNQKVQGHIAYNIRMEPGVQSPEKTLRIKRGSCRDSAWLLVQILRYLGLAARFASGYLVQLQPDQESLDGPNGAAEDFTDLHAWCEVYLPGAGWVGLDPTSGLFASEGHIPLACTPDPSSAAPIVGATDECEVEFDFVNKVTRIHEDPRVTKPYEEKDWQDILALGDAVEKEFVDNDVRLTMGGEPTFVSIDDMESGQWNTEALGADKLSLSKTLLLRLRDKFAPNGMLHYGQGKWYPGEEVPRWALGLFWRTDGEPLWQDPKYLARVDKDYGYDLPEATKFAGQLCTLLGLPKKYRQPAYEDGLHYLIQQQKVPVNVDLLASKVKGDLDRRRLCRLLEKGFEKPAGYVIPVEWNFNQQAWRSSIWQLKRERIILMPGDSPLGLRLPLNDLPWVEDETHAERDHFSPRSTLAKRDAIQFPSEELPDDQNGSEEPSEAVLTDVIRTALSVEAREGRIHVFMPPLTYLEHYVEIIAAVEEVAKSLDLPVIIEGYEPPKDYRMKKLLVTPDPGVIEVNIHPSNNWRELVDTTTLLYDEARQSRLATEKFMTDGRHTGTGGGNHVTFGGATPEDSPLLRRPDLLRSLVTYWQHHPSLSYLFSGMFIGPTSQAPRVDEGRSEMLYELEIAFQQMSDGEVSQPWMVDRLMRNLLIDITSNTHRAEFCIDKLYSPSSATGRLGILEFRGFEMPPHSRMAVVQALLLRSLLARFWKTPYKKPLVRWGTELHDKFMLPYYVNQDILNVVEDLNDHGYPFDAKWLAPFEEFRFPHYGRTKFGNVEIELRWAIEPWHVLGEEVGSFGTSRYVDSSLERLQLKVTGMTDGRYVISCNGRRVPLKSTHQHGEFVAGIRYRAWNPPSALHPSIGVQVPLVFDLIDTWNNRSVGGCSYHVSHPGGRSYDSFPINAMEAESRRTNRFMPIDHTPSPVGNTQVASVPISNVQRPNVSRDFVVDRRESISMNPPVEELSGEYSHTLDLRRMPTR